MTLPLNAMTPRSRKILVRAGDEAEAAGQHYIGTEHLLLALATEEDGVASQLLDLLGVRGQVADATRRAVVTSGPSKRSAGNSDAKANVVLGGGGAANYPIRISH